MYISGPASANEGGLRTLDTFRPVILLDTHSSCEAVAARDHPPFFATFPWFPAPVGRGFILQVSRIPVPFRRDGPPSPGVTTSGMRFAARIVGGRARVCRIDNR